MLPSWANAHDWYPKECCHDTLKECRELPEGAVVEDPNGYTITADRWIIYVLRSDSRVRFSPDMKYHLCSNVYTGVLTEKSNAIAYCFFIPARFY